MNARRLIRSPRRRGRAAWAALRGRAPSPVEFEQIERIEEDAPVIAPVAQPVEHRQAIIVASYSLAID
jgi:hypothetical protein